MAATQSCSDSGDIRVLLSVPAQSISKVPFIIAFDQGLYKKHGLNVELWTPPPGNPAGVSVYGDLLTRIQRYIGINTPRAPDIYVDGGVPMMVGAAQNGEAERQIMVGSTDCAVRVQIVARDGIGKIEDLKGKKIGVGAFRGTVAFQGLLLAQRMGWDTKTDVSIVPNAGTIEDMTKGTVDAVLINEGELVKAQRQGLPVLFDTTEWNESVAGNSIKVDPEWLKDETHREATRRLLKATSEAIALYHQRPEVAIQVLAEWYGVTDKKAAEAMYSRGAWIPKKPYACRDGIQKAMELYDSEGMRKYKAEDFYDDSFMKELDATGFIDALYTEGPQSASTATK